MRATEKKEGYGYMIDWIVRLGDLFWINLFYIGLYFLFTHENHIPYLSYQSKITLFLVINLCYFITSSLVRSNISQNIVFFDKIIQNTTIFIILYVIFLTAILAVIKIFVIPVVMWVLASFVLGIIFTAWRIIFRIFLKRYRLRGGNYKQVIIIGAGAIGKSVYEELVGSDYGYKILGFFDDNDENKDSLPGYIGKIADMEAFVAENHIDEMFCSLSGERESQVSYLMSFSENHMIRFFLVPEYYKYVKRRMTLRFLNAIPVMTLRNEPLQHTANRITKRVLDILISGFVLMTIFPVFYAVFGLIIKCTSRGPVFFKQKRTGIQGKTFYCYKFRSMQMNAVANSKSATKRDPRVTKVGAFMRKTSVDEFPQFINVLMGDMSVVGPRPHMLKHTEEYSELINRFMVRHLIKPGITGWAQVSGCRGETKTVSDMEARVKKDVWYIENWTPFLDFKIIFLTVFNIFKGEENAY